MATERIKCESPDCKDIAVHTYNLKHLCELHYTMALGEEEGEELFGANAKTAAAPIKKGDLVLMQKEKAMPPCAGKGCSRGGKFELDGQRYCRWHYSAMKNKEAWDRKREAGITTRPKKKSRIESTCHFDQREKSRSEESRPDPARTWRLTLTRDDGERRMERGAISDAEARRIHNELFWR